MKLIYILPVVCALSKDWTINVFVFSTVKCNILNRTVFIQNNVSHLDSGGLMLVTVLR